MKCNQCDNPAMYHVGEQNIPLCLDCYYKYSQILQQQIENNERAMNFQLDRVNAITGLPLNVPRFPPRPQPVVLEGIKLHNINVNNSVVGTVNTGSIGTVDQSISALVQSGEPEVAEAIKALSEAVLQSNDLTQNQVNEVIESLSAISKEAATPKQTRQNTVVQSLLEKAMKITNLANDITEVCQKWWPILTAFFLGSGGG